MGEGVICDTRERHLAIEYNNMATIDYQRVYEATATDSNTITLAGESADGPVTANWTIEVPMNLVGVITYSGAYTVTTLDGVLTKTYPTVGFNAAALAAAAATTEASWLSNDSMEYLGVPNTVVPGLRKLFNLTTFSYTHPVFHAGEYPIEAVVKVQHGIMTATQLSDILVLESSSDENSHPVNAFEQCLQAGKIPTAELNNADNAGAAVFAAGDSIRVYVDYVLTKTRTFELDSTKSGGVASLTVGDITLDSKGASEQSDPVSVKVCWKFVQQA
jgi:hypothetical protein